MKPEAHVKAFPREREIIVDAGRLGARRPMIHALLELDVTRPRQLMRQYKDRTGESLSFTGYLVACLGRAIEAHPSVHSFRDWRGRLVFFDEVDVVALIETAAGEVALPHILRAANRKTFLEIHAEIRSIQARPARSEVKNRLYELAPYLPRSLRNLFYGALRKNPAWLKRNSGTVVLSSVGMFGKGGGWGIAFVPWHTAGFVAGGIVEKPGAVAGRIELREFLCLTASFDHDIVDGAPAARFARSLADWIEGGSLLEGL